MRIFRPCDAPTWLAQVLTSIETLFRQIMPGPFRLKDYATAALPAAAEHAQGLVYDSDDATLKLSNGADWTAYAKLDGSGKILVGQLPGLALTDIDTVGSEAAMIALVAQEGDIAVRTDLTKTFAHNGGTAGTAADWTELLSPPFQPLDSDLTAIAALSTATFGRGLLELANAAALRAAAGLVIGTDVQAYDADLAAVATSGLAAAWTAYTPTVASAGGTLGTSSAAGRFKQVGKIVFFTAQATITTNGTGATAIKISLPVAATTSSEAILSGRERQVTGKMLQAVLNPADASNAYVVVYDNSYPGGNGHVLDISGSYEAA